MFNIFKKKSYKVVEQNGIKKFVVAKTSEEKLREEIELKIQELETLKEKIEPLKSVAGVDALLEKYDGYIDMLKGRLEATDQLAKAEEDKNEAIYKLKTEFKDVDIRKLLNMKTQDIVSDIAAGVAEGLKSVDQELSKEVKKSESDMKKGDMEVLEKVETVVNNTPSEEEEVKEEKVEEKVEEPKEEVKEDAVDLLDGLDKAASKVQDGMILIATNVDPNNKKYKDSGIVEKLLKVNKEESIKSDNKVQTYTMNKGVITPGEKGSFIDQPTNKINPEKVVFNDNTKVNKAEGEKERLLPNKIEKMPKGDKTVFKFNDSSMVKVFTSVNMYSSFLQKFADVLEDKSKVKQLSDDQKLNFDKEMAAAGDDLNKQQEIITKYNVGDNTNNNGTQPTTASIDTTGMVKIAFEPSTDNDNGDSLNGTDVEQSDNFWLNNGFSIEEIKEEKEELPEGIESVEISDEFKSNLD